MDTKLCRRVDRWVQTGRLPEDPSLVLATLQTLRTAASPPGVRRHRLGLGYLQPLSLNDRDHHMAKAAATAHVRRLTCALATQAQIPTLTMPLVRLVGYAPTRRRRDADNLVATFKPALDGLRDAKVIADDNTDSVRLAMPHIIYPRPGEQLIPARKRAALPGGGWRFVLTLETVDERPPNLNPMEVSHGT